VALWGIVPSNKASQYERMQIGARVIFTGQARGFYTGTVLAKFRNPELAMRLWSVDKSDLTWEYMYAIGDDHPIDVSGPDLNRAIGYVLNAPIRGFTVLDDERSESALELIYSSLTMSQVLPLVINPSPRRSADRTLRDLTDPDAVLSAIQEFDVLGRDQFLTKYGYGRARTFMLRWDEKDYDSKAIAGAALAYQPGVELPLTAAEFNGGETGAVARLRALGFRVRGTQASVPARLVTASAIRQAMTEWDTLGKEEFLQRRHATGAARYHLVENGRSYDAKPIVQAAYAIDHPDQPALEAGDFRGDRRTIAEPLQELGFWVETDEPETDEAEPPLGHDPQRYIEAAARVLGPLDRPVVGTARREQGLLRGALGLYGEGEAVCGICGRTFPKSLLVAAHIKKRAQCSPEEQLDLPAIGIPACKLGCDALFEDGYVTIGNDGTVVALRPKSATMDLVAITDSLAGLVSNAWSPAREKYFEWHRTFYASAPS
jgi:hypothetical protein